VRWVARKLSRNSRHSLRREKLTARHQVDTRDEQPEILQLGMLEELLQREGDDIDLRRLSQAFPSKTPRIEKRKATLDGEERYFLILESETAREDEKMLADGKRVLAEMNAIMLKDGPGFKRPRIKGISKKTADGSLVTYVNVSLHGEIRMWGEVHVTLMGPDREIVQHQGPTDNQAIYELGRNNEPLQRAWLIYGSLEHTWINLYKVLDAMREAHGDLRGLQAKNYVPAKDIEDFKATAESLPAIGLLARHAKTKGVILNARMSLPEAQEMFRKLFEGWIAELKALAR
jgi:hypothetical protein